MFQVDSEGIPTDPAAYRSQEFWEWRYSNDSHHDWLSTPIQSLAPHLPVSPAAILILGCGTSSFSYELFQHFPHANIVNVDYSQSAIHIMHQKHPDLCWQVMDIRELQFENDFFDLVIDKATIDALFSDGQSPWSPSESVCRDVDRAVGEAFRVLKRDGHFVSISLGQPHFRLPHYSKCAWSQQVRVDAFGTFSHIYQFIK